MKKTRCENIEYYVAVDLTSLKFNVKTRHLKETSSTQSAPRVIVNIWSLFKGFLCVFSHTHSQASAAAVCVRLLLSVRWRLTEADTSCKHKKSDTSQVGMEARRREGSWGERQQEERMTDEFQVILGLCSPEMFLWTDGCVKQILVLPLVYVRLDLHHVFV